MPTTRRLTEPEEALLRAIEARYGPQRRDKLIFNDGQALIFVKNEDGDWRVTVNLTVTAEMLADGTIPDLQDHMSEWPKPETFAEAYAECQTALAANPTDHDALYRWGNELAAQATRRRGQEALTLFEAACEKYDRVLALDPKNYQALCNWGQALAHCAELTPGEKADSLYEAAYEKFAEGLAIEPGKHDDCELLYNWGVDLYQQAKTREVADDALPLVEAACEKFERALAVAPDMEDALWRWGVALGSLGRIVRGRQGDELLAAACEKLAQAVAFNGRKHDALQSWANVLADRAQRTQGKRADALFAASYEKYEAAMAIKPNYYALCGWGEALLAQAQTKMGRRARSLIEDAREKFREAVTTQPKGQQARRRLRECQRLLDSS
jgi:tetratricopeptide (TPR) repeat protein